MRRSETPSRIQDQSSGKNLVNSGPGTRDDDFVGSRNSVPARSGSLWPLRNYNKVRDFAADLLVHQSMGVCVQVHVAYIDERRRSKPTKPSGKELTFGYLSITVEVISIQPILSPHKNGNIIDLVS